MNKPTTERAIAFLAMNPTLLGRIHGVDLYESPNRGDEVPLYAITKDGRLKKTNHWEVPAPSDAFDLIGL